MTLLSADDITQQTRAETLARQNWLGNLHADLEWAFGRDGSLTGRTPDGRWWADCSVTLLAGRALLKTMDESPLGSCLLAPAHAGLLLAARERVGSASVLMVLHPNVPAVRIILGCHDFSAEIRQHRLWFAVGSDWQRQLRQMFDNYPGLATPHRFIRTKLLPAEAADTLIAAGQSVFSEVLENRAKMIADLHGSKTIASNQILLVVRSQFRLWDNGSDILQAELCDLTNNPNAEKSGDFTIREFDTDDPLSTSPLALATAAYECGSVVAANICRADSNHLVPIEHSWITWLTRAMIPAFSTAGPADALILADNRWRSLARDAGWPDDRVHVCPWPMSMIRTAESNASGHLSTHGSAVGLANQIIAKPTLGLLCDTGTIQIPRSIGEFSSHAILWEMIEAELHTDPLVVDDADHYLRNRAGQLNIDLETLDKPGFIEHLILPAYQQGLARLLIAAGLPIRLCGRGWELIPEFTNHAQGPLITRSDFQTAVDSSTAFDAAGKPVLHRWGREPSLFIRDARRILGASHPRVMVDAGDCNRLGRMVIKLIGQARASLK
jgi:hypothetical protein